MVAFIVFVPFLGKNGYMADVTRHGKDAPSGVMETIIYEAFQVFKEEGVRKNGSINIGIPDNTEGIPSILFIPLENEYLKVSPSAINESRKGI